MNLLRPSRPFEVYNQPLHRKPRTFEVKDIGIHFTSHYSNPLAVKKQKNVKTSETNHSKCDFSMQGILENYNQFLTCNIGNVNSKRHINIFHGDCCSRLCYLFI